MLSIKYNNNWYELEFDGIKIFETNYTSNFIKNVFFCPDQKFNIDGANFSTKNIILINDFCKVSDFLTLSKNNFIYKKIIDKIADRSLINDELINNIINEINTELELPDLLEIQYDLNKIILAIFDLNNSGYINNDDLFQILNKIEFDEKKVLIFDNYKDIDFQKCKRLLNNFYIFIVTSDIRGIIKNYKELEICCFINKTIWEVLDIDKLISYLELKLSDQILEDDLNKYLNNDLSKKSFLINFYLKNI